MSQLLSAPIDNSNNVQQPNISPDALGENAWSAMPTSYQIYQTKLNAAIPDNQNLNNISSSSYGLPGPNAFGTMNAPAGVENSSLKNISLCAANLNNLPAGNYGSLASSLLPSPESTKFEGQTDCEINKNELANQVFLSAVGQIGFNTNPGTVQNLDLRAVPPNPIMNISPWLNSTIYPDLLRRPLEENAPSYGIYGNGKNAITNPSTINTQ